MKITYNVEKLKFSLCSLCHYKMALYKISNEKSTLLICRKCLEEIKSDERFIVKESENIKNDTGLNQSRVPGLYKSSSLLYGDILHDDEWIDDRSPGRNDFMNMKIIYAWIFFDNDRYNYKFVGDNIRIYYPDKNYNKTWNNYIEYNYNGDFLSYNGVQYKDLDIKNLSENRDLVSELTK